MYLIRMFRRRSLCYNLQRQTIEIKISFEIKVRIKDHSFSSAERIDVRYFCRKSR